MKKKLLRILGLIFALGAMVTGGILVWRSVTQNRTQDKLSNIRQQVQTADQAGNRSSDAAEQHPAADSDPAQAASSQPASAICEDAAEDTAESAVPAAEPAEQVQRDSILPQYAALAEQYADFAGWLTIGQDDVIDTPVVRGTDNEFYLDHDFDGQSAWGGAIFMDCQNELNPLSRNTILYGHHLADQFEDRMFGELTQYKDQDYATANQIFYFSTPYQAYQAKIFSCYTIYPSDWRLYSTTFVDDDDFMSYCSDAIARSCCAFEASVGPADRIITLSTCDYTAKDTRFIVHAVLSPLDS